MNSNPPNNSRHSELAEESRVLMSGILWQRQHARFLGKLGMTTFFD
jgi:hypothetical protein